MVQETVSFAEVVESSLTGWVAQSWQWDVAPPFGSLVAISDDKRTLFGVVHQIETGSVDPLRYPFAYQKTEQELMREQPQIFEFLKTTFSCVVVAYQEKSAISYLIAPEPAKIHAFVGHASENCVQKIVSDSHYLPLLFMHSSGIFNIDELLLAMIKNHVFGAFFSHDRLKNFVKNYAFMVGNDYRRIKLFLERLEHVIEQKKNGCAFQ